MVIRIASIPLHLQKQITAKMQYSDAKCFRESSQHGRDLGEMVKLTMDVSTIYISMEDTKIKKVMKLFSRPILLSSAKRQKNCPRFCSRLIRFTEHITNERCVQLIREIEKGFFTGSQMILEGDMHLSSVNDSLFIQLIESLALPKLQCCYLERRLMELPMLHNMEIFLKFVTPDDALVSIPAPKMHLTTESSFTTSTLNQVLKEWVNNERRIISMKLIRSINSKTDYPKMKVEELFRDLSYSVIRSPESENSKKLGYHTVLDLKMPTFYVLHCGTKVLLIYFDGAFFFAREVLNPEEIGNYKKAFATYCYSL